MVHGTSWAGHLREGEGGAERHPGILRGDALGVARRKSAGVVKGVPMSRGEGEELLGGAG